MRGVMEAVVYCLRRGWKPWVVFTDNDFEHPITGSH